MPVTPSSESYQTLDTLYAVTRLIREAEEMGLALSIILPRVMALAVEKLEVPHASLIVVKPNGVLQEAWVVAAGTVNHVHGADPFYNKIVARGVAGSAIRTRAVVRVDDTTNDSRWIVRNPAFRSSVEPYSVLSVPLIARGASIGALTVTRAGRARFTAADEELLSLIAGQAAIAVDNARLYAESQRSLQFATLLSEAGRELNASLERGDILARLLSRTHRFLQSDVTLIALADAVGSSLIVQSAVGDRASGLVGRLLPLDDSVPGWAMQYRQSRLLAEQNPALASSYWRRLLDTIPTSAVVVPLLVKDTAIGVLVAAGLPGKRLEPETVELLEALTHLAGNALANADQLARTRIAEARYNNLFANSLNAIVLTDVNGVIVDTNRRAAQLFERSKTTLVGLSLNALHAAQVDVARLLAGGNDGDAWLENEIVMGDGETRPVEIRSKRIGTLDADLVQWIYTDRTPQGSLDRLRDDWTAMLVHDLQNPISNILSSLELLELELLSGNGDPVVGNVVDVAQRSARRLRHMVYSLQDIGRLETGRSIGERESIALHTIVDNVLETLNGSLLQHSVTFAVDLPETLPDLQVNVDMIERVLLNLVDNAVKHSARGDTISLHATHNPAAATVRLTVSDEGPGVPVAYRTAIFTKYFRAPGETGRGTGLGLSFCRLAVEAHGGRIWVDSAPGGGAAFHVELPLSAA